VRLYAAGSHPALKYLVRFECGGHSAVRANDRADGLPWEFGLGVDQGDDVHLLAPYLFPVSDLNAMRPSRKDALKYDCINRKSKIWFTFVQEDE
jgi:hypothetical protein